MSYFMDDETTEIDELKDRFDNLQGHVLDLPFSVVTENVDSGPNSNNNSNPSSRTAPKDISNTDNTTNIGVINGNKTVDLAATSKDILYGTLIGDSIITLTNADQITNVSIELILGTIINSLVIGGKSFPLTGYAVGDRILISAKTIDTGTTWFLAKGGKLPPSTARELDVYPGKYGDSFNQDQLTATWLPSLEGEAVKYVAEISKTSNFATILEIKTDIDGLSYSFLGLDSDTRYYVRVRGKNQYGESEWYPSPPYYSVRTEKPIPTIP